MPVDFSLKSLHIECFRGIESLDIDFPSSRFLSLIGPNNSSKSAVLNALAFALDGPSFINHEVSEFDFYRSDKPTSEFKIELHFGCENEEHLPAVRGIGKPVLIHGSRVVGKRKTVRKREILEHTRELFTSDGETAYYSPRTPLAQSDKKTYEDHGVGYVKYKARWRDIEKFRPEVWLLKPDNLYLSLYTWKTGPLQKLASIVADRFAEDKWTVQFKDAERRMPEALRAVHDFLLHAISEFPFWKNELRPLLEKTIGEYVGQTATIALRPDARKLEDWLASQLIVSFAAESGSTVTPLRSMGDGWQSLIRIASLDALSQLGGEMREKIVLLYEEPETNLHPHLRRRLRTVLERLADKGWYVIFTTHSPEFVRFNSRQTVLRLSRKDGKICQGRVETEKFDPAIKFQERMDERSTHEMLFANRVILCEGQDDIFALKSYLALSGKVDLDARGISLVRTGDVGQIAGHAEIAKKLNITWHSLIDQDPGNQSTDACRKNIAKHAVGENVMAEWPGNLETCLLIKAGKAKPDVQEKLFKSATLDEIKKKYPDYAKTCETVEAALLNK